MQTGFTLVEMAIVMLIITLLLTGLVPTITSQIEQRQRIETRKQMDEIQQALIGFALINGRLPCPANPALLTSTANAGIEVATCTTLAGTVNGVLPWVTLGVPETDTWGSRFTYRVTEYFADSIAAGTVQTTGTCLSVPTASSFALCTEGDITIKDGSGNNVAPNIAAVVVSHGLKSSGAFTPQGGAIRIPGAAGDELENANNDTTFISKTTETGFDDLVVWVSPNILFNRMVAAGKLP
jgi:prepilin-type N-terminal cleavage/methylation domain-containing protein